MKPRYKIVAGPTQMRIERFGYKSEPIDVADEHIECDNQAAKDFYYRYMHASCQEYIRLKWTTECIKWGILKREVKELVEKYPTMHFDGPAWIISTVPWKQAKYGEWFMVGKRARWLLKKEYTNGVCNRQEEAPGVSTV